MIRTSPAETKLLICVWHAFALWNPPPEMPERIRARWPEMRVVHLPSYDHILDELPDTDIFVGFSLRPEQFAHARKLKWLHSTAAGVGQLMYLELQKSGIEVTNASGVHRVPMAEHILGTLIALARRFPDCFRYQQQAHWAQQELWHAPVRPRELHGRILLFIGFGAIGREVAKIIRPLGMRVWAVTRSGRTEEGLAEQVFPASKLDEASQEPLPPENPLWKLNNVFITPHMSAASEHLWERQTDLLMENLERWFAGDELLNRVDLNRGY